MSVVFMRIGMCPKNSTSVGEFGRAAETDVSFPDSKEKEVYLAHLEGTEAPAGAVHIFNVIIFSGMSCWKSSMCNICVTALARPCRAGKDGVLKSPERWPPSLIS